jgi:hypothetical protein
MTHPFFDELREPGTKLPNGRRSHSRGVGCSAQQRLCSSGDAEGASYECMHMLQMLHACRLCRAAGRPLPPLFNWLPGELDEVPADIVRKLQPVKAP